MGSTDVATTSFTITSTAGEQSAEWVGTIDDLTITQRVSFGNSDLAIRVAVEIENTGGTTANDVWYTRFVNPDQESDYYTGDVITLNYVRYQASGPASYVSGTPFESLAWAVGINNEELAFGIRSTDSRAHVRHGGGANYDPIDLFVSGTDKDDWQDFGGANIRPLHEDSGDMDRADDAFHIGFDVGDMVDEALTSFAFSYLLSTDGYVPALSANHIYVQLVDLYGDGWEEDLYLAAYHDDSTEPDLYSLHCACKIVRLFSASDSGNMTISLYRNNTDEPGPRGKHVPFEWEALFTLSFSDGTSSTPLGVYGDVDTEVRIVNWAVASSSKDLDTDVSSPKNKCIPPPPPRKPAPTSVSNEESHSPPRPTVDLPFTVSESNGNSKLT